MGKNRIAAALRKRERERERWVDLSLDASHRSLERGSGRRETKAGTSPPEQSRVRAY